MRDNQDQPIAGLSAHWKDAFFFQIPMGWAEMSAEDRDAFTAGLAKRILAEADPYALKSKRECA